MSLFSESEVVGPCTDKSFAFIAGIFTFTPPPPHALMARTGKTFVFCFTQKLTDTKILFFFTFARSGWIIQEDSDIFWPSFRPIMLKFSNPGRSKTFSSFSKNVQTGAVPHPALYLTHCGRVTQICVLTRWNSVHLQVLLSATPQGGMFSEVSHPQTPLGSLMSISWKFQFTKIVSEFVINF